MQIKSLRVKSYRSFKVNDTLPSEAADRLRRLELFQTLRGEGCSEATALKAVGWSRATYYRWRRRFASEGPAGLCANSRRPHRVPLPRWSAAEERKVWATRRDFPFMGKRKLRVLLLREGVDLSESTVGRILSKGVRLGRIQPCAFCRGRVKVKQPRRFHGHAQRLPRGQTSRQPGELVQIDHLSASRDSKQLKEFKAVSPVGKQMVVQVFSRATARNAKRFLETVRAQLPFPLVSAQVDGGSEFRADFEQALRRTEDPPLRAAAQAAPTQRLRRTRQRHHPRRVLEPLRRRLHRRGRQPRARRLSTLLSPGPSAPGPRLHDTRRVSSKKQGQPLPVSHVLNPHKTLRIHLG